MRYRAQSTFNTDTRGGRMEPSDEALVLACRRGDAAAWETLIARYQRLVFSIPRRAGLDADLSAEVFQQVFTALLERLDHIEQPMYIGAWLATTARREARRVRRREHNGTFTSRDREDKDDDILDTALLPDELLLRLEEQHKVRAALASLDDRCRRLLILLFYRPDPVPYAEIAATIGMTEGSIGPTRARCLQKLCRILDAAGFFKMYFLVAVTLYLVERS
jgi:RNA polymerase sigma factor (sigma-70 family)